MPRLRKLKQPPVSLRLVRRTIVDGKDTAPMTIITVPRDLANVLVVSGKAELAGNPPSAWAKINADAERQEPQTVEVTQAFATVGGRVYLPGDRLTVPPQEAANLVQVGRAELADD